VKERPEEFRRWLTEAEKSARTLETSLQARTDSRANSRAGADQAFRNAATACTQCHAKYRDVPR
jgi:hypothetical protein